MRTYDKWDKKTPETDKLIAKVEAAVHAIVPDADIILYGSRARGDANLLSDWDFLVLTNHPLTQDIVRAIRDRLYDIELETDMVISSIVRTRKEWASKYYTVLPFKWAVEKDGVMVSWTTI
ncbi:MAG: nucleotidyltransferase domain-containing protein [Desulfobacterota bacterium]|nr:nucleotidyltransferase domain-containing protein [Thermodesulfobacteriota bacterium]